MQYNFDNLDKRIKRKKLQIQKQISKLPFLGVPYFYSYTEEGMRLKNMLLHKNVKGYPHVELSLTKEIEPTEEDLELTERLLKAYNTAVSDQRKSSHKDIWTFLAKGPHSDFFLLLKNENIDALAFYLCNMSRMGLTHGITQGKLEYIRIISDPVYHEWLALFNLDSLIRLAEAIGVLELEDPEQGNFGSAIFSDIDEIIKKIEKCLKIKIIPPNIEGGLYKLLTSKGGIHIRDVSAVYTSWRCKELLKNIENPSICEIGAGIGKTAYYSWLFGIKNYTLIDLPHINVLQGFYLIKALPSAEILLYGETGNKEDSISVLPDWSFQKIRNKRFNMTLNQDSFPEIDKRVVLGYLKQVKVNTKELLLSINQESRNTMMIGNLKQNVVSELVSEAKGYKRIYRFPYWMREGYVEELYKILE